MLSIKENWDYILLTFDEILNAISKFTETVSFNIADKQESLSIAIHLSIFELCVSSKYLLLNRLYVGIPVLIRSMIEALADLFLVLESNNNYKYLLLGYYIQRIQNLEMLYKHPARNQHRAEICLLLDKFWKERLDIEAEGYKPKSTPLLIRAYLGEKFEIIYRRCCSDTHNDLMALERRHIDVSEDGKNAKAIWFRDVSEDEIRLYIDGPTAACFSSCMKISSFFKIKEEKFIKAAINSYEKLKPYFI